MSLPGITLASGLCCFGLIGLPLNCFVLLSILICTSFTNGAYLHVCPLPDLQYFRVPLLLDDYLTAKVFDGILYIQLQIRGTTSYPNCGHLAAHVFRYHIARRRWLPSTVFPFSPVLGVGHASPSHDPFEKSYSLSAATLFDFCYMTCLNLLSFEMITWTEKVLNYRLVPILLDSGEISRKNKLLGKRAFGSAGSIQQSWLETLSLLAFTMPEKGMLLLAMASVLVLEIRKHATLSEFPAAAAGNMSYVHNTTIIRFCFIPKVKRRIPELENQKYSNNTLTTHSGTIHVTRLELSVFDRTAAVVVVMFDETATELVKVPADSVLKVEDEHSSLPPAIANIIGITHVLELKSHTYYEYGSFESFTCWKINPTEPVEESACSSTDDAIADKHIPSLKRLSMHPSVTTPSKPHDAKKTK
ncbi:hypothetical protein Tco_1294821, partial [Tanacetum coccineum]